ncbi:hypothetical protein FHX74_001360 [Friedmanniella endophytica]|uniref:Alanine racemase N-terminal domain-containing protein n=1 Tax=Microlunatus kandeliicorticis TaxID=1759536 RepID=A0A7W3P5D1_9ACTN|nr:alanine racemase [Microlunatus kandeliicorticis]MBA8793755.1 hypothetical protein [Microlunatus kandeliicorticis]
MTGLTLRLDGDGWRTHLRDVAANTPGLVPVIKGNGYGFGLRRLAQEAAGLGVDTVAVGVAAEVETVREVFGGSIVVLHPWQAGDPLATELASDPRVITTVSTVEHLAMLAGSGPSPRVLLEVLTSMRRHGIVPERLAETARQLEALNHGGVKFEGWTIHLPLLEKGRYAEAQRLGRAALAAHPGTLWLSHLPSAEAMALSRELTGADGRPAPLRQRVGTRLWLGAADSRSTTATVLDVHPVRRGERIGYRQRLVPADGWVLVIAGGTSQGVGLEAPTSASSIRQRAVALATGSLEATGLALSPYTVAGRKRWFLEPPHMQSSMVFLPGKETPPAVGDEVPVELRLTTATVDHIVES